MKDYFRVLQNLCILSKNQCVIIREYAVNKLSTLIAFHTSYKINSEKRMFDKIS